MAGTKLKAGQSSSYQDLLVANEDLAYCEERLIHLLVSVRIWVLSLVSAMTRSHIGYSMVQQEDSGMK